jgi:hypothetical protein
MIAERCTEFVIQRATSRIFRVFYNKPILQIQEFPDDARANEVLFAVLINAAECGDKKAVGSLFSILYEKLHRPAQRGTREAGVAGSLGATTLLHEAYLSMTHRAAI